MTEALEKKRAADTYRKSIELIYFFFFSWKRERADNLLSTSMADLDDFFAKKDRKKSKTKKFATSDELAKKLEDTTKKCDLKRKETQLPLTQSDAPAVEIESADQVIVAEVSLCF